MTPIEAKEIMDAGKTRMEQRNIRVRLRRSGAEYVVHRDSIEVGSDDWTAPDAYVYGCRVNGTRGGPFHRRTQGQTKWFLLSNAEHVPGSVDC